LYTVEQREGSIYTNSEPAAQHLKNSTSAICTTQFLHCLSATFTFYNTINCLQFILLATWWRT